MGHVPRLGKWSEALPATICTAWAYGLLAKAWRRWRWADPTGGRGEEEEEEELVMD
jgi:hypothetical protein